MKTPKFATDAVGMCHIRCKDCGKFFKARDEATCLRFFKLHITKAHSDGASIKLPPMTKM